MLEFGINHLMVVFIHTRFNKQSVKQWAHFVYQCLLICFFIHLKQNLYRTLREDCRQTIHLQYIYVDDVLFLKNSIFGEYVNVIYHSEIVKTIQLTALYRNLYLNYDAQKNCMTKPMTSINNCSFLSSHIQGSSAYEVFASQ